MSKMWNKVRSMCYDTVTGNTNNDAFIPQKWAMEGLAILLENMVMANLVHRDFENYIANYGDVVNTRRPGTFKLQRKTDQDAVNSQTANATNVQVKLNQHIYQSFVIKDGEATLSFQDLVQVYLLPAMQAIARTIDRGLLGQVAQFLGSPTKRAGALGGLSSSTARDWIVDVNEIMNINRAYVDGRKLILAPTAQSAFLRTDIFTQAQQRGDQGDALTQAVLGRIFGFDTYVAQNVPFLSSDASTDVVTGTITNALAAGVGGSQACSILSYAVNDGEFVDVVGNDQPAFATAKTAATNTTAITLSEVNKYATLADAVVTVYKAITVNGSYPANQADEILIDGWTAGAPQVGQLLAFGTGAGRATYVVVESYVDPNTATIQHVLLDRPLDFLLSDNDLAFPGPVGSYNLAFHRNSLALVTRPLASPPAATGVMASVANFSDVSMRVTLQYDSSLQGTRCNLDLLGGFAVLDPNLACVLLG